MNQVKPLLEVLRSTLPATVDVLSRDTSEGGIAQRVIVLR